MVSTSNAIESRGGIVWKRVLMSIRKRTQDGELKT